MPLPHRVKSLGSSTEAHETLHMGTPVCGKYREHMRQPLPRAGTTKGEEDAMPTPPT